MHALRTGCHIIATLQRKSGNRVFFAIESASVLCTMAKLRFTGEDLMRKLLLSSLAATTMVGSALAADLRPPPPYVPPAPVATWTGLYIGINGGGIWTNSRDFVTTGTDFGRTGFAPTWSTAAALAATNVITINNRAQGLIGGTWGYNWQWGSFVVGTESDFDGVFGCRNDNNGNFGFFGGNNNNTCGGTAIGLAAVGPPVPGGFSILESAGRHTAASTGFGPRG